MSTTQQQPTLIPTGTWRVDAASSELGFRARGVFGVVPVTGRFASFEGAMSVDDDEARGELRIHAASLHTGNTKRDAHLRSADFFDVDNHPIVTFELTGLTGKGDTTMGASGLLRIRDNALGIDAPVQASLESPERLVLTTALTVDRAAAGIGWSKMGMIQGKAHLRATLTLIREP